MENSQHQTLRREILSGEPFWRFIPRLEGTSSNLVTVLDEEGMIRYQSPPIKWVLGYEPSQVEGRPLTTFLHEQSQQTARQAVDRMTEEEKPAAHWELCFRAASGNYWWLEGMATNFLKDPRLGGILVYWRISEAPHAE